MKKILAIIAFVVVVVLFYAYYSSRPQVLKPGKVGKSYSDFAYSCGSYPWTVTGKLPPGIQIGSGPMALLETHGPSLLSVRGIPTRVGVYTFSVSGKASFQNNVTKIESCHIVIKIAE